MVRVPAGKFTMGSPDDDESPVRSVHVDAFEIDKYLVTNADYGKFMAAGGYDTRAYWSADGWESRTARHWTAPGFWGKDGYRSGPGWPTFPVLGVSYYEAEAYAAFVGKRLPTEAEWEKAARGTDARTYPWGDSLDGSRANYARSGDPYETGDIQPTPVGFYDGRRNANPIFQTTDSPSPCGAYDMAGNLQEWVQDWYGTYDKDQLTNPHGPGTGDFRVLRGGSFSNTASFMRCAARWSGNADNQSYCYGFRCARSGK
jgi:formylglycine-generating enzyme required for sulfatase activity